MIDEHSVGVVERYSFTFATDEPMRLESGASLGPVTIAYETYGRLNNERTNAILIVHALSGSAHAAGYHSEEDAKPGWWDECIGPAKPLIPTATLSSVAMSWAVAMARPAHQALTRQRESTMA